MDNKWSQALHMLSLFDILVFHSNYKCTRTHTQIYWPVAHFMSYCKGDRQPRILIDVAAAMGLTHPRQMRQTQSLTGLIHSSTDVFPEGGDTSKPSVSLPHSHQEKGKWTFHLSYWECQCVRGYVCTTCLVISTATSWWAGCVSLWGFRFFCQAQKLAKVVSAWWTIFNPFCNNEHNQSNKSRRLRFF